MLGSLCDNAEARFGNAIDRRGRSRDAEEREAGLDLDTSIARKLAQNGFREFLAFDFRSAASPSPSTDQKSNAKNSRKAFCASFLAMELSR